VWHAALREGKAKKWNDNQPASNACKIFRNNQYEEVAVLLLPMAPLVAVFVPTSWSQQDSTMNKMAKQANLSDLHCYAYFVLYYQLNSVALLFSPQLLPPTAPIIAVSVSTGWLLHFVPTSCCCCSLCCLKFFQLGFHQFINVSVSVYCCCNCLVLCLFGWLLLFFVATRLLMLLLPPPVDWLFPHYCCFLCLCRLNCYLFRANWLHFLLPLLAAGLWRCWSIATFF